MPNTNSRSRSRRGNGEPFSEYNSAEYLSWRRLHLSKSKLSSVAQMAGFMSGFAVMGTIELQINEDYNKALLTAYVITTSLLVGTCMVALVIARCVLPHLETVAKTSEISRADQSPHDAMMRLIDISWILTNLASLFFFTLDIILMFWIKFTIFSEEASIAATIIMAPLLVIIVVFALVFYRKIIKHQYVISSISIQELDKMQEQLERQLSVASMSYQGTLNSNYHSVTSSHSRQIYAPYRDNYPETRPSFYIPSNSSQDPSPQTPRNPRMDSRPPTRSSQFSPQQNQNGHMTTMNPNLRLESARARFLRDSQESTDDLSNPNESDNSLKLS